MYEFGKGALKFTDHRSSINRTPITSNPPLPVPNYWKPRARRYMSSGQLVFIREYVSSATPTPVITYTIGSPLPTINPVTGDVFTLEESHQLALATLKPVSPWFPITLVGSLATTCRSPDYVNLVGDQPIIYIYRLIDDPSISYIGSAEQGNVRFRTHREHCSMFIRGVASPRTGCKAFYAAVKQHGWPAFEIAVLAYCPLKSLKTFENAWLALKPELNSIHYVFGKARLSATAIAAMSARMKGANNPFFGQKHSEETKYAMMLSKGEAVFQYDMEYNYTGLQFPSLNEVSRKTGADLKAVLSAAKYGGPVNQLHYSKIAPTLDASSGLLMLAFADRLHNPLSGTGSHVRVLVRVESSTSDVVQCFAALKRATDIIRLGNLWPGHSLSYNSVKTSYQSAVDGVFSAKVFTFTILTEDAFLEWYSKATPAQRVLAFTPTKHGKSKL